MRTVIGFLLMCLGPLALSQDTQGYDPWVKQLTNLPNRYTGCMMFAVDSSTFWSVFEPWEGTSQAYLRTTNAGATWLYDTVHAASSEYNSVSTYAFDADRAWVLMDNKVTGSGGGLFATTNGGQTWREDTTVFRNGGILDFIYFFDAKNGVCVGDPQDGVFKIYTTSDSGVIWTRVPEQNIPGSLAGEGGKTHVFAAAGSSLWAPTMFLPPQAGKGRIYRTTDKGTTWSVLVYPTVPLWYYPKIAFQDENVGLGNGAWGDLQKTTDGGLTWSVIPTSFNFAFQDLKYVPQTQGMYIASAAWSYNSLAQKYLRGTVYTLDAGVHWTIASASTMPTPPTNFELPLLSFTAPTLGWQGDMASNIYKWTVPSGRIVGVHPDSLVFSTLEVGSKGDTILVDFVNHGSDPVTLTGIEIPGTEFTLTRQPSLPATLPSFGSARVELCFAPITGGTHRDSLVFVSNASNVPRARLYLEGTALAILEPAQAGVLYAASTGQLRASFHTINTTSGAVDTVGPLGVSEISGMSIRHSDTVVYAAYPTSTTTTLYRISAVSGAAVPVKTLPVGNLRAIAFSRWDSLYGASISGTLYRIDLSTGHVDSLGTTHGLVYSGLSFRPRTNELWASVRYPLDSIFTVNTTTGVATFVGVTGFNALTSSIAFDANGVLFGLIDDGSGVNYLSTIDTISGAGTIVAGPLEVQHLSAIAMRSGGLMTSVGSMSTNIPLKTELYQCYPNPFNPATIIRYALGANRGKGTANSAVRLTVYDILGREVATLVNERQAPGGYEIKFDGVNLSSGVYFYRLTVDRIAETHSMILLR